MPQQPRINRQMEKTKIKMIRFSVIRGDKVWASGHQLAAAEDWIQMMIRILIVLAMETKTMIIRTGIDTVENNQMISMMTPIMIQKTPNLDSKVHQYLCKIPPKPAVQVKRSRRLNHLERKSSSRQIFQRRRSPRRVEHLERISKMMSNFRANFLRCTVFTMIKYKVQNWTKKIIKVNLIRLKRSWSLQLSQMSMEAMRKRDMKKECRRMLISMFASSKVQNYLNWRQTQTNCIHRICILNLISKDIQIWAIQCVLVLAHRQISRSSSNTY